MSSGNDQVSPDSVVGTGKLLSAAIMIFFTLTTSGAPSKDAIKLVNLLFHDEPAETINFKKQQFYERLSSAIQTLKSLNIQNTLKYHTTSEKPHITPAYSDLLNSNHINSYSNPSRTQANQNSQISELTNDQPNVQNFISVTRPTNPQSRSRRVTRSSSRSTRELSPPRHHSSSSSSFNRFVTIASTSGPATGNHRGRQQN